MSGISPCALVIYGASGDLAKRKLIPAIYELARAKLLPEQFALVSYARSEMSDEAYRREAREAVKQFGGGGRGGDGIDERVWQSVESRLFYFQASDYGSAEDHERLARRLEELDESHGTAGNRLFYLSTPPETFGPIIEQIGERLLGKRRSDPFDRLRAGYATERRRGGRSDGATKGGEAKAWRRIVIEKPFGRDLPSARALNQLLYRYFDERQVFRIDHYLGKETVQNLMVMRFANAIFEPIWTHKYIDHVQITVSETDGIGSRGGYYDQSGALRDMVQNHLFQLMALVAMEPPVALDAISIRDEKVKVYKSIRPVRPAAADDVAIRGQYGAGECAKATERRSDKATKGGGEGMTNDEGRMTNDNRGYLGEKGVAAESKTETFAAVKLFVDNWRWSGMPFYLRTGKCLPEKLSEIVVRFRSPPLALFQKQCESPVYPNDLIIRVQPEEGISWRLNGKVPGSAMNIKSVSLNFLYATAFNAEPPEAYQRLIHDALTGDQTLFIRGDEVEACWAVIDPIAQGWAESSRPPETYAPGSWGPKRAMDLIELDGRRWLQGSGAAEPIIACEL